MKSNLTEKLLSICGSADKTYGYNDIKSITHYFFKKEPLKRTYPKFVEPEPIKPLTPKQLKELGLSINVDVSDCKNFKEASKVQEQIINGDVKINIIKK